MGEGQGRSQQIADTIKVMLVLLYGFNAHPVSGQQSFIAWGIAGWGHELKVSMTTTKKKSSPGKTIIINK